MISVKSFKNRAESLKDGDCQPEPLRHGSRLPTQKLSRNPAGLNHVKGHGFRHINNV